MGQSSTPTAHAQRDLRTVAGKSLSSSIEHHLQDLEHRTQQITQSSSKCYYVTSILEQLQIYQQINSLDTDHKKNKSSRSLQEPNKMGPESLKATRTEAHQFTKDSQNTSCC